MTDLTKNVLEEATNCGIIDLAYVQDKIDEMKKQKISGNAPIFNYIRKRRFLAHLFTFRK